MPFTDYSPARRIIHPHSEGTSEGQGQEQWHSGVRSRCSHSRCASSSRLPTGPSDTTCAAPDRPAQGAPRVRTTPDPSAVLQGSPAQGATATASPSCPANVTHSPAGRPASAPATAPRSAECVQPWGQLLPTGRPSAGGARRARGFCRARPQRGAAHRIHFGSHGDQAADAGAVPFLWKISGISAAGFGSLNRNP